MNVYPVSSPTLSIPRVRIKSDVLDFNGNVEKSYTTPTPHHLIRPGFVSAQAGPGISDLFVLGGVPKAGLIMNRRYTLVESVTISDSAGNDIVIPCMLRPDARDHIGGEPANLEFVTVGEVAAGGGSELVNKIQLVVDFNYNTGEITVAGVVTADPSCILTYNLKEITVALKFTAKGSDKGRTISHVEQEMTDITIDPNEDFIISLTTEELQD